MTDQEKVTLIETEQRSKVNSHRIDGIEEELREIKSEQKAIYSIATSVEVIAQRVGSIESKIDETKKTVEEQGKALQETDRKLSEKISEVENSPNKRTANNVNSVKVAIITAILTALASGAVAAIITLMH